jgi:hypothetical protein
MPITIEGRRCVVGFLRNSFVVVEAATGKQLFRRELSTGYNEHSAWPIYREPHLMLLSPFRVPAVRWSLRTSQDGALDCRTQWTSRGMSNDVVSSVLHKDHVYGFDLRQTQSRKHRCTRGTFKCMEWSTGKVCWSAENVGHAALIEADGKLLMITDNGSLIMARANPTSYQELGRVHLFNDNSDVCWTPPALWRGRLYVRGPSQMVCLHVGRPEDRPAGALAATSVRTSNSASLRSASLLTRVRDSQDETPSWQEMTSWFAAFVFVLAASAVLAGLVYLVLKRRFNVQPSGALLMLGFALVLGCLGPNVFSSLCDRLLFTLPAALHAEFNLTLLGCAQAGRSPAKRGTRWLAGLLVVGLLFFCYGYFELCRAAGMYISWVALLGLVPALPLSLLAVRAVVKGERTLLIAAWTVLAFAVFFWSSQLLVACHTCKPDCQTTSN